MKEPLNQRNLIYWNNEIFQKTKKLFQKVSFFWVIPYFNEKILFKKKTILELEGEYLDEYVNKSYYNNEKLLNGGLIKPTALLRRIIQVKWEIILGVILLKIGNIFVSFIFSSYLSGFMKSETPKEHLKLGIKTIIVYLLRLIFESQNRFHSGKLALEIESFLLRLSYSRLVFSFNHKKRKSNLKDGNEGKNQISNIMNIVLADCSSFPNLITSTLDLLTFPLRFFLTWVLLKEHVGSVAISSVLAFLIVFSLGFFLQIIGSLFKAPFMRYRDIRISKTHEMLRQISQIRLLEQENLIMNKIFEIRKKETFYNRLRLILVQIGTFLDYHVQTISQLVLFISYISKVINDNSNLQNESLKSLGPTGVTVLNIFFTVSSIRGLPSNMIEGFISLIRFQKFLRDTENVVKSYKTEFEHCKNNQLFSEDVILDFKGRKVVESNHSLMKLVEMEERKEDLKLLIKETDSRMTATYEYFKDLSVQVRKKEKVFIIGESGSGKTTLIQEILLNRGFLFDTQDINSYFYYNYYLLNNLPIGYVSQIPWIPSGTIRSIILFGSEYDEDHYMKIIECCNLVTDFQQWKEGDLKQVDEGGNSLSKGQKTRICIARTLYRFFSKTNLNLGSEFCPLFIFDDIFCNLDHSVANKLFHNLFNSNGILSNSSVVITIDQNSLSTFLKYSSILDSSSSFSLYHSFRYIFIENFNYSPISFKVPQQVLINNVESILTDTRVETLLNNHNMIFSPKNPNNINPTSLSSISDSSYIVDLNSSSEFSRQNTESDKFISNNNSCIINSFNEKVTNKGYISLKNYNWYLSKVGKPIIILLITLLFSKSTFERLSELLFTGNSTHAHTLKKFLLLYSLSTSLSLICGGLAFFLEAIACTFGANEIYKSIFDLLLIKVPNIIPIHIMLNRIGGDMLIIDTCIVKSIISGLAPVLTIIGQTVFIIYTFPYFTPFFLVWIMVIIKPICFKFISSYREYQRFSISLFSSICGIFSGTQLGGSTITMLKKQEVLRSQANESIDLYIKVRYIQLASTQWAGFWMNMAMTPVGIILNILLTQLGFESKSSSAFICIYYFLSIAESISSLMYKFVQLEKEMCSVERIKNYIETFTMLNEHILMNEKNHIQDYRSGCYTPLAINSKDSDTFTIIPIFEEDHIIDGPNNKGLIIKDLQISTLNNFSIGKEFNQESVNDLKFETLLTINGTLRAYPGNVIGIIGRTGSGKSSLINSIMGLHLQNRGVILLNNIDIRIIKKKNQIIGLLPQESLIISGATIRSLLDPFTEYSDYLILRALKKTKLLGFIQSLPLKLETIIISQDSNELSTYSIQSESNNTTIRLSNSQIRYLSFIQFVISPLRYQLLLIDEPPQNVTFSYKDNVFETTSIHNIINSTFKHCPSLIITHDINIFNNCDIFWIIKNGQLNKVIHKQFKDFSNYILKELI
ncbi:ABC transporter family protein [Cryptosporidium ubiquitum]|uniref:ABC transporter family protein n=1 Tax=Cryptosporidium ubiquitum TaxID=857276 RepID=A0A1J4MEK8_9CRYT|nr:ABC transporter family protein [Cryptosporidium ubiquitum]OII72423.1 ABC transporter family protein [Cryptosporidium ubiquitum]